ncbi:MAG: tyrosine-protein phosphatase [Kurthia sp.]|nr:tyrosine-protein phosphatase [Candidatus Kurthia equi]
MDSLDYRFDGIPNFRDMGGLETRNGRKVKQGLLFRSGEMSKSSEKDRHILVNDLGLKTILDYRDDAEVASHPTPEMVGVKNVHIPASRAVLSIASIEEMSKSNLIELFDLEKLKEFYEDLPIDNPAYKELVKLIQQAEGPILQHCSAGKDRTGVGAFITYLILDVPVKTIVMDFLMTNKYMRKNPPYWLEAVQENIKDPEVIEVIVGVNPKYIFYTYDKILNNFDTIEEYLLETYGIDEEERKRIQDLYLD